ncbi:MAG: peptidase [Gemmatimonadetes bacterium]|nr:peptidase [Gemmatimonadota bacterium]
MTLRRLALTALVAVVAGCSSDGSSPTGPDPDPQPGSYDHRRSTGASAADLLSSENYDSLVIQVQYVEGHRPTDQGLAILRDFLDARVNKPGGISIQIEPVSIPSQATYSVSDVVEFEQVHRTAFTEGTTLAIYFLFLDGEFSDNANVLGFAYYNTSMAIFQDKIEDNTGGALQPSQSMVEGIVLNHEIGHNLGLVANGSPMQTEHQDEPNGKHCDNENCLMYWTVRTLDFISNLTGDAPDLDQNCLDDLQSNGGR